MDIPLLVVLLWFAVVYYVLFGFRKVSSQELGLRYSRLVKRLRSSRKVSLSFTVIFALIIFLFAFSFRAWDISGAGETTDEESYVPVGLQYVYNLRHLDFAYGNWIANYEHPPVAKYIYGFVMYSLDPTGLDYASARLASALIGALTCVLVYLFGREFIDERTGLLAAFILAFLPYFVAHNKVAGLETPSVFFYTLTIYFLVKALNTRDPGLYYRLSAVSCALLLSVRLNNVTVVPLLILFYIIHNKDQFTGKKHIKLPVDLVVYPLLVAVLFFVLWPFLWNYPLESLSSLFNFHLSKGPITEIFMDNLIETNILSYYPLYFLGTTPIVILFLLVLSLIKLVLEPKKSSLLYVFLWFIVPFLQSFFTLHVDGIRYVLPVYPPLALLSAVGLFYLVDCLADRLSYVRENMRNFTLLLSTLVVIYLMVSCLSVHPYYLDYYNELVGGPRGVYDSKVFQIGYWAEGIGDAVDYVNRNAESYSAVTLLLNPPHTAPALRTDLLTVSPSQVTGINPDYVVMNTRYMWENAVSIDPRVYTPVYVVDVAGAPLATVYKANKSFTSDLIAFEDWFVGIPEYMVYDVLGYGSNYSNSTELAWVPVDLPVRDRMNLSVFNFTGWVYLSNVDEMVNVTADDCISSLFVNDVLVGRYSCSYCRDCNGRVFNLSNHAVRGWNTFFVEVVNYNDTVYLGVELVG